MSLIDLNALLLEFKKMESEYYASEFEEDNIMGLGVMMAIRKVKDAPTIEAEPVRHAQWVDNHCTACGMTPIDDMLYEPLNITPPVLEYFMRRCPFCGAKMDKKSPENHKKYQEEETNKKAFK